MNKEFYDKVATVVPMSGVIDEYMASLRSAVEDATNQAENGSQLGVAVAVGRIKIIADELFSAWLSVKQ